MLILLEIINSDSFGNTLVTCLTVHPSSSFRPPARPPPLPPFYHPSLYGPSPSMPFKTIAVTGATGFVGSHVAVGLLDRGYIVHATARNPSPERVTHLTSHPTASVHLRVFEADLLVDGSFDAAFTGCDAVMHVASPFNLKAKDPYHDVIKPAVSGTLNVLKSCVKHGVKKVVLTSSIVAVSTKASANGHVDTESDWNDYATQSHLPYMYSKKAAEKAAWDFIREDDVDIDLIVINPSVILGPILNNHIYAESFDLVRDVVAGKMFGIVNISVNVVDVRDVAAAHFNALENRAARGRYICSASSHRKQVSVRDIVKVAKLNGFDPPEKDLSGPVMTSVIKLASFFMNGQHGDMVRWIVGNKFQVSNTKIKADLGMSFRPVEETLSDTLDTLVKWGHIKPVNI